MKFIETSGPLNKFELENDHYNIERKEGALALLDKSFRHFVDNLSD